MIEFGDDLLYTSSIFDQMPLPASNEEASWVGLYSAIVDKIARHHPSLPKETVLNFKEVPIIGQLVDIARKQIKDSETHALYEKELIRCIRDFDGIPSELIADDDDESSGAPNEVDPEQGYASSLWLLSGKPSMKVSREAMCGLALMLGISLDWHQKSLSLNGEGAFGLSLSANQSNTTSHL